MKETLELRVNYEFAELLFRKEEGRNIGTSVKLVELSKGDSRINEIPLMEKYVNNKYNKSFYFGWEIKRSYSSKELESSILFNIKIKTIFEPTGEECGTLYDESTACPICGANRSQKSPLILKLGSIPKTDISKTIGGEIVVSEKFANLFESKGFKGAIFEPVITNGHSSEYYQLKSDEELEVAPETIAGIDPFNLETSDNGEIYKCPLGHTLGLNLISELKLINTKQLGNYDLYKTKQKIGVKRGFLNPESLYVCSSEIQRLISEQKLRGFSFEIARVI